MAAIVKNKYIWEKSFKCFRRIDVFGRKSHFVSSVRIWWDIDKIKKQRERK